MKKQLGITLIALVVTITILIILAGVSINTLIGDNGIITKAKQARENIIYAGQEEQEQLNQLYWEMDQEGIHTEDEEDAKKDQMIELLQKQVEELKGQIKEQEDTIKDLQNQWGDLGTQLGQTNADASHILKDYKAYSKGKLVTGTMANNGEISATLNCGKSYVIPEGYHNGSGKITANSLASQTQATATANNLSNGVTAWVNGQKITGNGTDVNNSYNNGYNVGRTSGVSIMSQYSYGSSDCYSYSDVTYNVTNVNTVILGGIDTSYSVNWAYSYVALYIDGNCIFERGGNAWDNGVSNQAIIDACSKSYDVSGNSSFRIVTRGMWNQQVGIKNIKFQ